MSMACVGSEQAVIAQEVTSRAGDQGGESSNEVERFEEHVGGAVGVGAFELVDDKAVAVETQALEGDGRTE